MTRDVERLLTAGPGPLHDPASSVRLTRCEDELKDSRTPPRRSEGANDDALLLAWKQKRLELKGLRNDVGATLNHDVYQPLVC